MKRLVAVLLCMTMAVSITACGNSETENNKVAGTEAGDKPEIIAVVILLLSLLYLKAGKTED